MRQVILVAISLAGSGALANSMLASAAALRPGHSNLVALVQNNAEKAATTANGGVIEDANGDGAANTDTITGGTVDAITAIDANGSVATRIGGSAGATGSGAKKTSTKSRD